MGSVLRKYTVLLIIVVSVMQCFYGCGKKNQENNMIKFGVTLPLTGDAASYGKEALNGLNLAVGEINTKGGINGKPIKLFVEDDAGTPKGGVAAINNLLATNRDMQVVIGGAFSQIAAAQMPICDRKGIVLFSPYASNPDLAKPGDCLFRNWPSDTEEGKNMAQYAFEKLGIKRVAILASNSDYGVGIRKVFEHEFKKLGGEIPVAEEFKEGDTDFRAQLVKIKASDAKGLYMVGWYKEYALILKQLKELAINIQILSCVTFNKPELLKLAGNTAEGAIFTQPAYSADNGDPTTSKFVKAFKAKYGAEPGIYAAQAYDAVYLLAEAAKSGTSAEKIKKGLYAIKDYPGVTGLTTFDKNGDVLKPVQFWMVKDGKYIQISQ